MKLSGDLVDGIFLRKLNRFAAMVEVNGRPAMAHIPNSGRMTELLVAGAPALLAARPGPRKTPYDLMMIRHDARWVGIDARLPPRLVEEAMIAGLADLGPFDSIRREVRFGESRLDLLASGPGGSCFIEVKSVNLVRGHMALFPDAPTSRGARHLEELRRASLAGYRAAVVFVVQRDDADRLMAFEEADPLFATMLRSVCPPVEARAYACRLERGEIYIERSIPVVL